MLLESDFRKRGLRDRVTFAVYTPEPAPMPVTGQANSDLVKQMVEGKGIEFYPSHALNTVDRIRYPSTFHHFGKVMVEKYWFYHRL
jgi:sulfide:quinone oxidoreductase